MRVEREAKAAFQEGVFLGMFEHVPDPRDKLFLATVMLKVELEQIEGNLTPGLVSFDVPDLIESVRDVAEEMAIDDPKGAA